MRILVLFVAVAVVAVLAIARPVATTAAQPCIDGAAGTVWVTERTPGVSTVAAFDGATGEVLGTTPVGSTPIGVTQPPGTGKVYSSDEAANQLSVIDAATRTWLRAIPMGPKPHHLMATSDGRRIYVAEYGRRTIGVVNTSTDTKVAEFVASGVTGALTHAVWITPDGKSLYATNEAPIASNRGTISRLDATTGALLWEIEIGVRPSEILVTPDGLTAYVSVRNENKVKVVDLRTSPGVVVGETIIGTMPDTLQLTTDGSTLVVGLRGTPQMALMATATLAVTPITVPGYGISGHEWLSDNSRYTFIAMEGLTSTSTGALALIDNITGEVVRTSPYPTGLSRPHGVYYVHADDGEQAECDIDDGDQDG